MTWLQSIKGGEVPDGDGRIRLTWAQIAWGISVLVLLAGSWARNEYRLGLMEASQKELSVTVSLNGIALTTLTSTVAAQGAATASLAATVAARGRPTYGAGH